MSLGPPFDERGELLRVGTGAAAGLFLLLTLSLAMLWSAHALGETFTLHVDLLRPGALQTGAPVRLAGDTVGEIVAIRGRSLPTHAPSGSTAQRPGVDVELRVRLDFASRIRKNARVVTVNPTLLSPAFLEIGPPPPGTPPGPPVTRADHLLGDEPADLDILLSRVYKILESTRKELLDLQPDWQDVDQRVRVLGDHLDESVPEAELLRLTFHASSLRVGLAQLQAKLAPIDGAPIRSELAALQKAQPPLILATGKLLQELDTLRQGVAALDTAVAVRRRDLQQAWALFTVIARLFERVDRDAQFLQRQAQAGRGTLGAFSRDIEIFDDLKEIHRILKRNAWRLLIKRKEPPPRPASPPKQ